MRQIVYISKSTLPVGPAAIDAILVQSRHNNALDGVTGLLWSDGQRFIQVLEGDERAVDDAMARIRRDDRHSELAVVRDRLIAERQFGDWAMKLGTAGEVFAGNAGDTRQLGDASDPIHTVLGSLIKPGQAGSLTL